MTLVRMEVGTPTGRPVAVVPAEFVSSRTHPVYAHRPRAAHDYDGRLAVDLWCGQSLVHGGDWHDTIPEHLTECATCHGRWRAQHDDDLGFEPHRGLRDLTPGNRRWCPGSRTSLHVERGWASPTSVRVVGDCLLCGYHGRILHRLEQHEPVSPNALLWCPTCGWRHLYRDGPVVRCRRFQCDYTAPIPT